MLREIREDNRMTQEALAAMVGVSQSTISQIEKELIKPSVPLAKKIATVLGCKWTDFFEDEYAESEIFTEN